MDNYVKDDHYISDLKNYLERPDAEPLTDSLLLSNKVGGYRKYRGGEYTKLPLRFRQYYLSLVKSAKGKTIAAYIPKGDTGEDNIGYNLCHFFSDFSAHVYSRIWSAEVNFMGKPGVFGPPPFWSFENKDGKVLERVKWYEKGNTWGFVLTDSNGKLREWWWRGIDKYVKEEVVDEWIISKLFECSSRDPIHFPHSKVLSYILSWS